MNNPVDETRRAKIWERLPGLRDHISRRRPGFVNSKTGEGGEGVGGDFPDLFCPGGPAQRGKRDGSFFPGDDFSSFGRNLSLLPLLLSLLERITSLFP